MGHSSPIEFEKMIAAQSDMYQTFRLVSKYGTTIIRFKGDELMRMENLDASGKPTSLWLRGIVDGEEVNAKCAKREAFVTFYNSLPSSKKSGSLQ